MKRIYWVTGKGGVGKSLYSVALAKYLNSINQNTIYVSAENDAPHELLSAIEIPSLDLSADKSSELYISMKFKSKVIAKAIVSTPFFKSIFNILPALGNLMFLGHLVHLLEKDPTLTIIVDMPASGHALTLIESSFLFERIFKTGVIFKDIINIHDFLYAKRNLELVILTLPTLMAIEETVELQASLKERGLENISLVLNNLLSLAKFDIELLPANVKEKIQQEEIIVKTFEQHISKQLPYYSSLDEQIIVERMIETLGANDE